MLAKKERLLIPMVISIRFPFHFLPVPCHVLQISQCLNFREERWGDGERFSLHRGIRENLIPTPEKPFLLPPWAEMAARVQETSENKKKLTCADCRQRCSRSEIQEKMRKNPFIDDIAEEAQSLEEELDEGSNDAPQGRVDNLDDDDEECMDLSD